MSVTDTLLDRLRMKGEANPLTLSSAHSLPADGQDRQTLKGYFAFKASLMFLKISSLLVEEMLFRDPSF
jgi:hypothetical protein